MPKIDKRRRFDAVIKVLERLGSGNIHTIRERVCSVLGIEVVNYNEKTFYRDMAELVDNCEVDLVHPEERRKVWSVEKIEHHITSEGLLKQAGGLCYASNLFTDIQFDHVARMGLTPPNVQITLILPSGQVTLRISLQEIPCQILLSRVRDKLTPKSLAPLHAQYGQRLIVIQVPYATVSSIKPSALGHALIKIESSERILIEDLNSANGTFTANLSSAQIEKIVQTHEQVTVDSAAIDVDQIAMQRLRINEPLLLLQPALVILGTEMKVIVQVG